MALTVFLRLTSAILQFEAYRNHVITFFSPSCLGQETAKGAFGLRVKLPAAQ